MTPEEMRAVSDVAKISNFLPYIEEEINRMKRTVEVKVMEKIRKGELTPEYSQNAWFELASYNRLLKSLETRVRTGTSVGEKYTVELNLTGANNA